MNVAQFTRSYLEHWLRELAGLGYDAIIWEVENNIQWETCPECVAPDAFSKEDFKGLLSLCGELGLESIPLLQTIGHAEYVLKHAQYEHMKETPERLDQYCPRHPEVLPFLKQWIGEYLDLFGEVNYFHIGADEAWALGVCDRCRAFVDEHSLSELYIQHINAVSEPLIARGITPIIWADMVLKHGEALDKLSRNVMLFDWLYDIYPALGKVFVWEGRYGTFYTKDELPPKVRARFDGALFPFGDEPGREPETFYTADYLAQQGFKVVTCPASSSVGDSVFTPRNWYHMINTFGWVRKGLSPHLHGSAQTSWTVRQFMWELQAASIDMLPYLHRNAEASIEEYQRHFMNERFGVDDETFWRACGLLSKPCLFSTSGTLGFYKDARHVPRDFVKKMMARLVEEKRLDAQIDNTTQRLEEYRAALPLFAEFAGKAKKGQETLDIWNLMARNLINRAEAALFLLRHEKDGLKAAPEEDGRRILETLRGLKKETSSFYSSVQKPARCNEIIGWVFDSVEHALAGCVEKQQR